VTDFSPLTDELERWCEAGLIARLWLRDDDASDASEALARLVQLSDRFQVPMLLAVVPKPATERLRDQVAGHGGLTIAVHGFRHMSHAAPGEKSIELGGERSLADIAEELRFSRQRLSALFGDRLTRILVPPWNRVRADCVAQLPQLGFACLSTFGKAAEAAGTPGLAQLNTHLDIIDWKGTRGGRDPVWLVAELVRLLSASRAAGGSEPIGVLTHHLDHDEVAWDFLEALFEATAQHDTVDWKAAADLL
jgi:hypothetical protein